MNITNDNIDVVPQLSIEDSVCKIFCDNYLRVNSDNLGQLESGCVYHYHVKIKLKIIIM